MKCPNCFFELVFREYSQKYKCAKCGNIFPKKEIDLNEFLKWNKRQREIEIEKEIKNEIEKMLIKFAFLSVIRKASKCESVLLNRVLDRDLYNLKKREYWAKCREHLLEKRRENYNRQKDKILKQQALYRQNNKLLRRINHLRTRQKELAQQFIKNESFKPLTFEFECTLPTSPLSYLLQE